MEILESNSTSIKFKENSIENVLSHFEGLEEEISRLQLKIDSLRNENLVLIKKNELNQLNKELEASNINKFNSLMNECVKIDSENQKSNQLVLELNLKIQTLNNEISALKINSSEEIQRIRTEKEESNNKVSSLISEVTDLNSKLSTSLDLLEKTKEELQLNSAHLNELKIDNQRLNETLNQVNSELNRNFALIKIIENEKQEQVLRYENLNSSLNKDLVDLKNEIGNIELENRTSKEAWFAEKQHYQTEINSLLTEINALNHSSKQNQDQFEKSKKYFEEVVNQLENEISKSKDINSEINNSCNSLTTTINQMSHDKNELLLKLEKQVELLANEKESHALLTTQLNQREKQFSQFVLSQNQEKSKYQRIVSQLAREIQQAITLHPLNDYLSVTEKEISRLEWELKITPTLSGNRKSLEISIGMLIEQRDHLKLLISRSENLLLSKTSSLERILNSGLLTETPPMPPL